MATGLYIIAVPSMGITQSCQVHLNCTIINTQPYILNHVEDVDFTLCLGIIGQYCDECALVQRRWGHRD